MASGPSAPTSATTGSIPPARGRSSTARSWSPISAATPRPRRGSLVSEETLDKTLNLIQSLNMVRSLAIAGDDGESGAEASLGRRARNRLARHRSYLRAAQVIVARDGVEGLTMQRVADHLDCAVGTIYTYFPSKSALIAELQRTAIEKLTSSYLVVRADTDRLLDADEPSARIRALARLV